MAIQSWKEALDLLTEMGWGADEIETACEALNEACEDGEFEGEDALDLEPRQVERLIGDDLSTAEGKAFQLLAQTVALDDGDAEELRAALWNLDDE